MVGPRLLAALALTVAGASVPACSTGIDEWCNQAVECGQFEAVEGCRETLEQHFDDSPVDRSACEEVLSSCVAEANRELMTDEDGTPTETADQVVQAACPSSTTNSPLIPGSCVRFDLCSLCRTERRPNQPAPYFCHPFIQ